MSLAAIPPLNGPLPPTEAAGPLAVLAIAGVALFGFAAFRSSRFYIERGGVLVLAVAVALALLGEAMLAIALSRNWQLSWWLWHVLMLIAFLAIALGTRAEYRRSGSLTGAFGGLYLEATLARIDRWHARAIAAVAAAGDRPEAADRVLDELRREGASSDEIALVAEAAGEVERLDALFRPYLPSHVARDLRQEPSIGRLGGVEREVSVMFADLAGFTTFSETRSPSEVIAMLNRYWADVVPLIDASGGVVEQFAGDGVMASFNTTGEMADHARRAAGTALGIVAVGDAVACRRARELAALPRGRQHRNGRGRHRRFDRAPAVSRSSAIRRIPRRASSPWASPDRSWSRSRRGRRWAKAATAYRWDRRE